MLKLSTKILINKENLDKPNLATLLSPDDQKQLGNHIWEGYNKDLRSREKWEKRTESAMNLAMQVLKDKTFPWPKCANVAFPLITIGAMQFHSRAYPALVSNDKLVGCRVYGDDPDGSKKALADKRSNHMTYQFLEEDADWEEQHDRMLLINPIVGCSFKKTYYHAKEDYIESDLVMAKHLVLNYYSKSVESCPRKTHVIYMDRNDVYERVRRKTFVDILGEPWYTTFTAPATLPRQNEPDNRTGTQPPETPDEQTPLCILEQHVNLDLDQDGYAEPYIATIEESSHTLLRLVLRFIRMDDVEKTPQGKIISIKALEYFTKYPFIPSPDGGIYDIAFGHLLGPNNESVNSLINQLLDAGTMQTSAGGFLGRGVKIRGGNYSFGPLEWKRVDSSGDDLRKGIVPLPVNAPSDVLYKLLVLLIQYSDRITASTEIMVGENVGQNTPAETSRTMVEQGMKIYAGIYKRIWRSMKQEFKKVYILNGIYLPAFKTYGTSASKVGRGDYLGNPEEIVPAADPNVVSDAQALNRILAVKQSAMQTPGYNMDEVEREYLRVLKVPNVDVIFPGSDKVPPSKHPRIQVEEIKLQAKQMQLESDKAKFMAQLMEEQRLNNAKILELEAQAVKLGADAKSEGAYAQAAILNAAIAALKAHNEGLQARIELMMQGLEYDRERADMQREGVSGVVGSSGNATGKKSAGGTTPGLEGPMGGGEPFGLGSSLARAT